MPLGRVLVVDDEPDLRDLLLMYLEGQGWEAVGAGDGASAAVALDATPFHAVIADWTLPGASATELVERAHDARCVALVMTGHGADLVPDAVADAVLRKPFTMLELGVRLAGLVRRQGDGGLA